MIGAARTDPARDPVLEMALGTETKHLEKDDLALTLASVITNLAYCTVVHCLSTIVEEVAVSTLDEKSVADYYDSKNITENSLSTRIDRLITEAMTVEFARRDERERPKAEAVVAAIMHAAGVTATERQA